MLRRRLQQQGQRQGRQRLVPEQGECLYIRMSHTLRRASKALRQRLQAGVTEQVRRTGLPCCQTWCIGIERIQPRRQAVRQWLQVGLADQQPVGERSWCVMPTAVSAIRLCRIGAGSDKPDVSIRTRS